MNDQTKGVSQASAGWDEVVSTYGELDAIRLLILAGFWPVGRRRPRAARSGASRWLDARDEWVDRREQRTP
jgi:hypothetical protein